MAQYHNRLTAAGARMVGISVDPPERNAAMVAKLRLPYPLLTHPDGEGAIKPYGVWDDGQDFARPAVVLVTLDESEALRQSGGLRRSSC